MTLGDLTGFLEEGCCAKNYDIVHTKIRFVILYKFLEPGQGRKPHKHPENEYLHAMHINSAPANECHEVEVSAISFNSFSSYYLLHYYAHHPQSSSSCPPSASTPPSPSSPSHPSSPNCPPPSSYNPLS